MSDARLRVAVLSELPTPYRWPLFVEVAREGSVDLTVLFYARTESDRDWAMKAESQPGGPVVEYLRGRAFHVGGKRSLYFHWNPQIRRRLREGAFDVVVLPGWSMPTTLAAWAACGAWRTPYVVFSESHDRTRRPGWRRVLKRGIVRRVVSGAAAWLATGSLSANYLAAHGADPARTFRFANTPDVAALRDAVAAARTSRDDVRASLDTPKDAPVVLFVGRLIGAKDVRTLLTAHGWSEAAGSAQHLWICGGGPEEIVLRREVEAHKLTRVRFLGARRPNALPPVWAAADVFCLPSVHEPWGVVVNEAMAAGLPVVVTNRVGASADLVEDGVNGLVVEPGDPGALATALQSVVADPARCKAMGRESERIIAGWGYAPSVEGFVSAVHAAAGARR